MSITAQNRAKQSRRQLATNADLDQLTKDTAEAIGKTEDALDLIQKQLDYLNTHTQGASNKDLAEKAIQLLKQQNDLADSLVKIALAVDSRFTSFNSLPWWKRFFNPKI